MECPEEILAPSVINPPMPMESTEEILPSLTPSVINPPTPMEISSSPTLAKMSSPRPASRSSESCEESDDDTDLTQVGTVNETFVSIRHTTSNFAYKIGVSIPVVKVEEFPEETLKFDVDLNRACLYCYSLIDDDQDEDSESPSADDSDSEKLESKEACLCTGRQYKCKLLFNSVSECILGEYSYQVSARFICQGNKDIFLFSHSFRKTHLLETLEGKCLQDQVNVPYSKVKEIRFEIHREKYNQVVSATLDQVDVCSQLLHMDPSIETAVLKTSEKSFYVNKKILSSRSKVFEKIFSCKTRKTKPKIVKVDDFDAEVIEMMLLYIYTSKVQVISKNPVDVYRAAHKYEIEDLMDRCVEWMKFNIDKNNFVPISRLASSYELKELREMITKFEETNIISLIDTEEYHNLLLHNLKVESVVHTLKICDKYSSSLREVQREVFSFVKENMSDIVEREDFMGMFKDNHTLIQKLFTFLYSKDGAKKRKLSDSLDDSMAKNTSVEPEEKSSPQVKNET